MPLGTLDRTPPPFFRQGPSALTKLVFFSALAVFLMVADARFRMVEPLRAGLAIVLLPAQQALLVPIEMLSGGADYFQGLRAALQGERQARAQLAEQADRLARAQQLAQENERLRALLDLKPALVVSSIAAEVMYEAADPYSRKLFIDRGQAQGVALGSPVINEAGVLGQVTRVYALTSEVTLLTDKDAAIPVLNTRTKQRSAAFGGANDGGGMELRFTSANADVKPGDTLHDQRRRRRLSAGPAGGPGADGGAARRIGLRAHRAGAGSVARRRAPRAGAGAAGQRSCRRGPRQTAEPPEEKPAAPAGAAGHDHAARVRPAAAAGQPLLHRLHAAGGAGRQHAALRAPRRRCPTCWRWCWCSGTCTSRAASAWAWPSCSGCCSTCTKARCSGSTRWPTRC